MSGEPILRVDLHSHVLPGLDDGARDDEHALAMLRIAAADGTGTLVATPHADQAERPVIEAAVARLNERARRHGLRLRVLAGSEIRLDADTARRFGAGELVTLNQTAYTLVELPLFGAWPAYAERALYDVQLAGGAPILAHVERYPGAQRDPGRLAALARAGVLLQVNADALDGRAQRRAAAATAATLVRANLVHLIASDAHGTRHRAPRLAAAGARVADLAGPAAAERIAANAARVIAGDPVEIPEPEDVRKRRWW